MMKSYLVTCTAAAFLLRGSVAFHVPRISSSLGTCALHAIAELEEPQTQIGNDQRSELPPVLREIADERREYELNLGKAMDTLRNDYPTMITKRPDFSIYHDDLRVIDPSGVQLHGLNSYKNSFTFFQSLVGVFYNTDRSSVQFRMVYDFARQTIRISWNVVLVPKIVGNRRNSLYIDGISSYKMDSGSGKIVEHKIDQMLINNTPVTPPYGVLSALRQELMNPQPIPVGVGAVMNTD